MPTTPSDWLSFGQKKLYNAINMKHARGIQNAADILKTSPSMPMNFGINAPPVIDITMNADAFFFDCEPSPWMPTAKIVGNMMDMKK